MRNRRMGAEKRHYRSNEELQKIAQEREANREELPASKKRKKMHPRSYSEKEERQGSVTYNKILSCEIKYGEGVVYLIELPNGRLKIGTSRWFADRMINIANEYRGPIKVLGIFEGGENLEKAIHWVMRAHRIKLEWGEQFEDCAEVRSLLTDNPVGLYLDRLEVFQEMFYPDHVDHEGE